MFKYKGMSFMGEYANRDTNENAIGSVKKGNSLNLQAGYLCKTNWEVAGRHTNVKV